MAGSLVLNNVSKSFGGIRALQNIFLEFIPGEIYCVIGPNGAGKTTMFNVITGFEKADDGVILYGKNNITKKNIVEISRIGIRRTFQETRHIWKLNCNENLLLGTLSENEPTFWDYLIHQIKAKKVFNNLIGSSERTFKKYEFINIANKIISETSYGQMKMVELLRCVYSKSNVLLLDEPLSGLSEKLMDNVINIISKLREKGKIIIVIEHNYRPVFTITDKVILIDKGKVVLQDKPEVVVNHPVTKRIYIRNESPQS